MIKFTVPVICMALFVLGLNLVNSKAYSKYSYELGDDSVLISSLFDHDSDDSDDGWDDEDEDFLKLNAKKDKKDKKSKKKKKKDKVKK